MLRKKLLNIGIFALITPSISAALMLGCRKEMGEGPNVHLVHSGAEVRNVLNDLQPGDTVLLAAGIWMDQDLSCVGEGKPDRPIVFGAEVPGETVLSGTSKLYIGGRFVVVRDLVFRNGRPAEEGSIIQFRSSDGINAFDCRLTNTSISGYNPSDDRLDTKYLALYGGRNRVDHCSLWGKTNSGATMVVWMDSIPDHHRIDHNYFGPRPPLGRNGAEALRIGTSHWERFASNCVVEYNLFEECDGEHEIISSKSVGNHFRYNTFRNNAGTLTLRHGSDCYVYGNFFFGTDDKECGGIRLIGPGHRVYNNYLENLTGRVYRAAICLANGVPNSPANRYRQVADAAVGFNTIVHCELPFAIGAGKDPEKSLPPVGSVIENNLVVTKEGREVVKDYDTSEGIAWKGNITDAEKIGVRQDGFVHGALPMMEKSMIKRPAPGNPAVGAAESGVFDTLSVDIDGQIRSSVAKDVGCDQDSDMPVVNHPLSREDVGAKYPSHIK